jgi:hypothetical protein
VCLTDLARAGWGLHEILQLAGHRSLETTKLYVQLSARDLSPRFQTCMDEVHAWRPETLSVTPPIRAHPMTGVAIAKANVKEAAWTWPIDAARYDRGEPLSDAERCALANELPAIRSPLCKRSLVSKINALRRLLALLEDTIVALDYHDVRYTDGAKRLLLTSCVKTGSSYWAWDDTTWRSILAAFPRAFCESHLPLRFHTCSRQTAVAIAYVLRCFTDVGSLGELQWVALAQKIFGKRRIIFSLDRLVDLSSGWGYRSARLTFQSWRQPFTLDSDTPNGAVGFFDIQARLRPK